MLLHSACGARIDSNYASNDRRPRQDVYRGNLKYSVPSYLNPGAYAKTVQSSDYRDANGNFNYEYQTDNGISVAQDSSGYGANKVVRGYYSYVGPDGRTYTVNYIADRFGYRAYGDHLPTQPDAVFDQTKFPVRPSNNRPLFPGSPQSSSPINQRPSYKPQAGFQQPAFQPPAYQPQSAFQSPVYQQQPGFQSQPAYSQPSGLQSKPIYVAEPSPGNYITITPKPGFQSSTQIPLSILPPHAYGSSHSNQYANPPHSWTTAPSLYDYDTGYNGVTTPRSYFSY